MCSFFGYWLGTPSFPADFRHPHGQADPIDVPAWAQGDAKGKLPVCYFDLVYVQNDNEFMLGRVEMTLAAHIVPKTARNFFELCARNGVGEGYRGSPFHRVIPGFMCQGGDYTHKNGRGGRSIYEGNYFEDENFKLPHTRPGIISMANCGSGTNSSQFFICTVATPQLDGKHVVFGYVSKGMNVIKAVESLGSSPLGTTAVDIIVKDCGILSAGGGSEEEEETRE